MDLTNEEFKSSTCYKTVVAKGTYNIKNWDAVPLNDVAALSKSVTR